MKGRLGSTAADRKMASASYSATLVDGHTASLVPGDPALEMNHRDVGFTGIYQGRYRMTLTYRAINRARRIVRVVTGSERQACFAGFAKVTRASRVSTRQALLIADRQAAEDVMVGMMDGA
jgi:6-phosphogluconolactonase/glucosamine-6-phosphate isomerase/deaminase